MAKEVTIMKHSSSSPRRHIWAADSVLIPSVRFGGVLRPLRLLFIVDQKNGLVVGYGFVSSLTSLSLIRLLNVSFHDYVPPDFIIADFISPFEFNSWGPAGSYSTKVVRSLSAFSPDRRGFMERTASRFKRFLHFHFGNEAPAYEALLLMTDIFFDDYCYPSADKTEVPG